MGCGGAQEGQEHELCTSLADVGELERNEATWRPLCLSGPQLTAQRLPPGPAVHSGRLLCLRGLQSTAQAPLCLMGSSLHTDFPLVPFSHPPPTPSPSTGN